MDPTAKDFAFRLRLLTLASLFGAITFLAGPLNWVEACTTVVISGKVTADGRPLLWKNRDTSKTRNEVACFNDGIHRAIAVVNAGSRDKVWMGVNETGFCIENSLSRDLAIPGDKDGPTNGGLMKIALLSCRTVSEFEALLEKTNVTGRDTVANYGVIDAEGGAAIFETGPTSFIKFDANNPEHAPRGYIVRSNFATSVYEFSPNPTPEEVLASDVYSKQRYARACKVLEERDAEMIDVAMLVRKMTRDMADSSGRPFPGTVAGTPGALPERIVTESTLSSTTTVSAAVFHGVRQGETPGSTTMWTFLGDPKFTIAVPCWVTDAPVAGPLTGRRGAEIGEIARTLRDWCLTPHEDAISTANLPGIWHDLWVLEDKLIKRVAEARSRWAEQGFDVADARELHTQAADHAMEAMQLELTQAKQEALYHVRTEALGDDRVADDEKIRVALYDSTRGGSASSKRLQSVLSEAAGFLCTVLHPDEIRLPKLHEYDLLIVPGGSGSMQSERLGEEGRNSIRQFVNEGGGYLGICAGAYLATTHYTWSLGLVNARVWDRPHWDRGKGTVSIAFSEKGIDALEPVSNVVPVHYVRGPLLLPGDRPDLPRYEALAAYHSEVASEGVPQGSMVDTHAMIRSEYGNGRVVCISPHPEHEKTTSWMVPSAVRWAAKPRMTRDNVR